MDEQEKPEARPEGNEDEQARPYLRYCQYPWNGHQLFSYETQDNKPLVFIYLEKA